MPQQYVSLEAFELQAAALRRFIREEVASEAAAGKLREGILRLHDRVWQLEGRVRILEKAALSSSLLLMIVGTTWVVLEALAG